MRGLAAEPRKKKRQRAHLLGLLEELSKGAPTSLQKKNLFHCFSAVVLCSLKSLFLQPIIHPPHKISSI